MATSNSISIARGNSSPLVAGIYGKGGSAESHWSAYLGGSANNSLTMGTSTSSGSNNGGILGGIGYLGEKLAVGFVSSFEGIVDYSAAGLAKLFGADDWAEDVIANDWFGDWYSHPDEWFQPSGGWKMAGDVASGIGTSLPAIGAYIGGVALAGATGGLGAGISATLIGGATSVLAAGLGAAGNATKEAYRKTGQLTGKEFGYGALTGLTEGTMEGVTNALTLGTGKIVKTIAGSLGKNFAKTAAKEVAETGLKATAKNLAGAFIGEAFEEGMSEALSPYWKRMTYDPNAENATAEEIGYSMLVGGLSGLFMDGGRIAAGTTSSYIKGNNLARSGKSSEVLSLSEQISSFYDQNQTDHESFKVVSDTYKKLSQSLASTNGEVVTVQQKKMLGDLQKANVSAVFTPIISKSAANIVSNADVIAERLNSYGMKDAKGNALSFTGDDIRAGIDTTNSKTLSKSFTEALKNNAVLRTLAVADATGHLMMDTAKFEQASLRGEQLASQVDLNRFYETATPAEIRSVSEALGIDNWATITPAVFNQKIKTFIENGGGERYAQSKQAAQTFESIPAQSAQKMPSAVDLTSDGAVRYTEGALSVAIEKKGNSYRIYDYGTGNLTKFVPAETINGYLQNYRTQADSLMAQEAARQQELAEVERFARENVSEYKNLNDANQSMIRKVIRNGRAAGISDADLATYATVSAHSGLDIVFDKDATYEKGTGKYADGYYSASENRIVVNPEGTRSAERLLLHELDHAIRQAHGVTAYRQALEGVSDEVRQNIVKAYEGVADAGNRTALVMDETNARYAEDILSNKHTLERLVQAEPTLKERILSFFKGASTDYADTPKLSGAAKKYYRTYKKLFDSFAEGNYQGNAYGGNTNKNAVTNMNTENMYVTGRDESVYTIQTAKYALEKEQDLSVIERLEGERIAGFIEEVNRMVDKSKQTKRKKKIGVLSESHAQAINALLKTINPDFSAIGYELWIDGTGAKHIEARHGKNGEQDSTMATKEAKMLIPWAAQNADLGEFIRDRKGNVKLSDRFYNSDGSKAPEIRLGRVLDGDTVYVSECVPDSANKIIWITSAYIKKGSKGQLLNMEENSSPQPTSETSFDGNATNNRIAQKTEKVNRKSEKTDKSFALPDDDVSQSLRETEKKRNFGYSEGQEAKKNPLDMLDSVAKKKKFYEPNAKDKLFTNYASLRIDTVDELYGVEYYLRKVGRRTDAEFLVNAARSSIGQAQTMIGSEQYNIFAKNPERLGKGLAEIIKPVKLKGDATYRRFNEYLLHWRHMDSMMLKDPKPIFFKKQGEESVALLRKESELRISELEGIHPEFKNIAEEVWAYFRNVNHMRLEAGLIGRRAEKRLNEMYPHYVPAMRDMSYDGHKLAQEKNTIAVSSTVKRAVGGGPDILDVFDAGAAQTKQMIRAGNINRLARAIYDAAKKSGDTTYVDILLEEDIGDAETVSADIDPIELRPKDNQIIFWYNGKKITMNVAKEIYKGFEGVSQTTVDFDSTLMKATNKINSTFKKLVTSLSPAFLIRNPIRDLQDAGINSKHPATFAKALPRAYREIYQNGEYWKLYRAMGGFSSSVFESRGGITASVGKRGFESIENLFEIKKDGIKGAWQKISRPGKVLLTGIENVNAVVEQATRLAEFIASVEAGENAQQALYNSAEVTTNFGRRGRIAKKLNATIMPFLNPSIQGFDKMFRNVSDVIRGEHVAKGIATLFSKVALIGLAPMIVNMLMYDDDEDYADLREADKENNFLIKAGDVFIKIPRGRVASVIGGAANRIAKTVKGEDADWKGYASNVVSQVTPVENMSRTIFSPFSDVANNLTWYGTAIEGREFETVAPKDRYDENTSVIAKAISDFLHTVGIGKAMEISPKKVHYLLDQYSGVIGDFILPATTAKAEKDFLSGNFTLDPATSNKLSTEFYEMYDQVQYAKTAGDDTAIYQVQYLNKVKKAISEMYKQKSEIQNSDLSSVDKLQQTRVIQVLINEAYKTALQDFELYTKAIEANVTVEEDSRFFNILESCESMESYERTVQTLRATEATRLMYGAERALAEYSGDVYAKCKMLNNAGVDYDMLYNYYFTVRGITSDKDRRGNTIAGSKRKKVVESIKGMNVSTDQRLLLICASGYALQDGDIRGVSAERAKTRLLRYLLRLRVSREEKAALAEMCGFEVRNGRILMKKS